MALQVLARAEVREQSGRASERRGLGAALLRTGVDSRQRRTHWLLPGEEEMHLQRW